MYLSASRLLLVTSVLAALGGCATTGPNQNVFHSTGHSFKMNGAVFTELEPDSYGQGAGRLTIRSRADAEAMDNMIKFFTVKASEAVSKNDPEQLAVAWHLGKTLTKARVEQAMTAEMFVNDLAMNRTGVASLPAGGRVFFPTRLYDDQMVPSRKKRASVEQILDDLAAVSGETIPWQDSIKVAAVGDGLSGLMGGASGGPRTDTFVSDEMKVGSAYAVQDARGNRYIAERVSDGLVLHNPGGSPTKVDLNQLNFMPVIERPDTYRYEAAKIVQNINGAFASSLQREATARHAGVYGHHTQAPNIVQLGDRKAFLNSDGSLAREDLAEVRKLYASDRAFKLAIDLTSLGDIQNDSQYAVFKQNCANYAFRVRHGEALEYATYSCRDRANNITYSRTYLVGNSMAMQSWDSLMRDKGHVEAMKKAHNYGKLAEAAGAFLPILGNLDGAVRCAGLPSAIYTLTKRYNESGMNGDIRKFVSPPEQDSPSSMSSALDCAQGIAGIGNIRHGLTGAARLARVEGAVSSQAYKDTTAMMHLLDTRALYGREGFGAVQSASKPLASSGASTLAKSFYDAAQHGNNLTELASAMRGVVN